MVFNPSATQTTKLKRGDGAGTEVFTDIPGLTSINPIGMARSLIDITNFDSTLREYRLAIPDGQEIAVQAWYDVADLQHKGLKDDLLSGVLRNFQMIFPLVPPQVTAAKIAFTGLVMGWNVQVEIDSVQRLSFTIKPTGNLVVTAPTAMEGFAADEDLEDAEAA
jgi:hypothetical protein